MKHVIINGHSVFVDDDDAWLLDAHKWWIQKAAGGLRYVAAKINGDTALLHRQIIQDAPQIDHKDGNGLNNCRSNIRPATYTQNRQNVPRYKNNKSGFKGVWAEDNKWAAQITVNKHKFRLGRFCIAEDAARAYDQAARIHFGEFARINFPGD